MLKLFISLFIVLQHAYTKALALPAEKKKGKRYISFSIVLLRRRIKLFTSALKGYLIQL